ncbi:MAG: STAS domain-containing protein [Campylobacterales bacterium]|nr:STAS domain-containing protein [Campylobacterales bacterium]NQY52284.1 STAS domain-containing protein [Campylobacteraceae bacterium]
MNLDIKKSSSQVQIIFIDDDRIDATNLKEIQSLLCPYVLEIQKSNVKELELDFTSINFIDSSGLAMIINIYKKLLEKDQNLTIINSGTFIQEIFNVTKLDTFINLR